MEQDDSNVVRSIRSWLDKQGFPLEMRVAREFQNRDFYVQQSAFYQSREGKPREIDVLAKFAESWTVERQAPPDVFVTVEFCAVCECKSGPKAQKPWVVFTARNDVILADDGFDMRLGTALATRLLMYEYSAGSDVAKLPLFVVGERVGYSVSCAHTDPQGDGPDVAWQAIMSLTAAAHSSRQEPSDHPAGIWCCQFVLPVLVVSTPLAECWLDSSGQVCIEERDELQTVSYHPNGDGTFEPTLLHIIRDSAMPRFVEEIRRAQNAVLQHEHEILACGSVLERSIAERSARPDK